LPLTGPVDIWMLRPIMHIVRPILAILVALSLAMAPIAGALAMPVSATLDSIVIASELAVTSAHDCCDQDGIPANRMVKDCQASAGCFSKCFSFFGVIFSDSGDQPYLGRAEPPFLAKTFRSQTIHPPIPPPRV
jgi:hypothetical protein